MKFRATAQAADVASITGRFGLRTIKRTSLTGAQLMAVTQGTVEQVVQELRKSSLVEYAQPNFVYYPRFTPNDALFSELWGLKYISAPQAWDITQGLPEIVVAVIDDGVQIDHPDLRSNIWVNVDEIPGNNKDDDENGYVDDVNGWDFLNKDNTVFEPGDYHGTHVAGTIAAVANATGVIGVAPRVKIMPLKFIGPHGGDTMNAIDAIKYAAENGAKAINASWGLVCDPVANPTCDDPALREAIDAANLVFVAAAGNEGNDNDQLPVLPAGLESSKIISVAAVNDQGDRAWFSNYGATTVDVAAPGEGILSTYPDSVPAAVYVSDAVYGAQAYYFAFPLERLGDAAARRQVMKSALANLGVGPGSRVLLVDDDNSEYDKINYVDYSTEYIDMVKTVTAAVYGWVAGDAHDGPTAGEMASYDVVLWFTGDAYGDASNTQQTLTPKDLTELKTYLGAGGKLILVGKDLAFGAADDDLFTTVLGVGVTEDAAPRAPTAIEGNVGTPLEGSRLSVSQGDLEYSDGLVVTGERTRAVMVYRTDGYQYLNGTSMAAPHVSGVAALILSRNPNLTPEQVISIIKSTTDARPSLAGKIVTGGTVNAYQALLATPVPTSGSGGAGGGGGGGGGGTVSAPSSEEEVEVGPEANIVRAFDGTVELDIPAGAFTPGAKLTIRMVDEPAEPGLEGLKPVSQVIEFDAGGAVPSKPVTVRVRYDRSKLTGLDPRKLGFYRKNDQNPDQWDYVGGVVDTVSGTVRVNLMHFSRYAVMAYDRTFADLQGHWSRGDVEVLVSRHLVQGVTERDFQPDRPITRAELAKLLVQMLMQDPAQGATLRRPAAPTFTDVPADAWYFSYVETAAQHGIIKGSDGRFRPDIPVTREEMAAMILRALGEEAAAQAADNRALPFRDAGDVAPWAKGYVTIALERGLLQGVSATAFAPRESATRAQAAAVVLRAMQRMGLITAPITLTGTVTVSQIEGRHLELEVTAGGEVTRYVLIPDDGGIARLLEAAVGKAVEVVGLVEDRPNIYMRGLLLRVLEVKTAD